MALPRRAIASETVLTVLSCDRSAGPAGAPGPDTLSAWLRSMHRRADRLLLTFDPAGAEVVAACVEAEQRCCTGIGWRLEQSDVVTLTITAGAEKLGVLAGPWDRAAAPDAVR